jgi:hypothetical protein
MGKAEKAFRILVYTRTSKRPLGREKERDITMRYVFSKIYVQKWEVSGPD